MVTAVSNSTTGSSASATAQPLDRDAFLKLLVAQLQYQDPMKPMEDTAFIAELAQFSSLEQMQNLNDNLSPLMSLIEPMVHNQASFEAVSWIGRTITAKDPDPPTYPNGKLVDPTKTGGDTAKDLSAKVDSVTFTQDGPILNVTVRQKVYDVDTGTVVERDVKKEIQLGGVMSVT